jgi:hypothetical protein
MDTKVLPRAGNVDGRAMKKNVVTFDVPNFFSVEDEDYFFKWIYSLAAFKDMKGAGRELRLTLKSSRLSKKDQRKLLAVFFRYNIDMRVLRTLLEPAEQWPSKAFWFKTVFGRGAVKPRA